MSSTALTGSIARWRFHVVVRLQNVRCRSTTSAINRGLRASRFVAEERLPRVRDRQHGVRQGGRAPAARAGTQRPKNAAFEASSAKWISRLLAHTKLLQTLEMTGSDTRDIIKRIRELLGLFNANAVPEADRSQVSEMQDAMVAQGLAIKGNVVQKAKSVIRIQPSGIFELIESSRASSTKPKGPHDAADSSGNNNSGRLHGKPPRLVRPDQYDDDVPIPLPYTHAASEFLYGGNVVMAALKANRRKLYRLYVHANSTSRVTEVEGRTGYECVRLAKQAEIRHSIEKNNRLLDRMSDGRPHNGIVMEASRLPAPPVLGLRLPDRRTSLIPVTLERQNADEIAVNGAPSAITAVSNTWRQPFVVLLDGITDPGNVGNIIRTCHFYGVDAVAVAINTCANLSSAVLAKASAGACEAVQFLALPQPSNFVYESSRAGWKIFAAVAPNPADLKPSAAHVSRKITSAEISEASPLAKHPCILMLGAEGEGLRANLRNRADVFVTIDGGPRSSTIPDVGVDSMNVGVAAGVLLEAFLRKPADAPEKQDTSGSLGW